jgi:type IV pilus assembly protein PilM
VANSIWKRELSLGRKRKESSEAPSVGHELDAEVPVEDPSGLSAEARIAPFMTPPADSAPLPAPSGDAPPLPPMTGDYGWLTDNFDPNEMPAAMPAVSAPTVHLPEQPRPVSPPVVPAAAAPSVVPPVVSVPEPVAPTVVEPAEAAPEKKPPIWKRELSLSRGSKEPREPKQPKEPRAKKVKEPKAKKIKEPKAEKVAEPKVPKEAAEKKPPIWKRDLSIGKSKTSAAAKEPGAKKSGMKKQRGGAGKVAGAKPGAGKTIIGLKIGASQVAAARVSNGATPELLQVARLPLPDGVVVGGELRDIETLAETLTELFAKNKLPKKGVRLGIANSRIGVRTFEIAGIDDPQQLANAIRYRAQETLPIPLEEAVLDWQVLSESTDPETGETTRHVLLVVAYRELVDRYVSACRKAGIRVDGIDIEAFAMLRALNAPLAPDDPPATGAQVVVNVGHDRSTFAVSDGRTCEFTRVLSWGGQSLSVAIARALDLSPSEAHPIKHALSLVATTAEPPEGITHETLATASDAVSRELQSFARELVSSLRFYQNQPGSLGIGELILTGGTAHMPGIGEELNRLIGVPVRIGDPLNRVAIPKKFREPEYALGSLTVAIGLGIED